MVRCAGCGAEIELSPDNKCPNCGHVINDKEIEVPTINSLSLKPAIKKLPKQIPDQLRYNTFHFHELSGFTVCGCAGKALTSIEIPESHNGKPVLSINRAAFRGNQDLVSVYLPPSLRCIDESAFEDCINLENVYGCQNLLFIGENAFRGCLHLSPQCDLMRIRIGCPPSSFAGCYQLPIIPTSL